MITLDRDAMECSTLIKCTALFPYLRSLNYCLTRILDSSVRNTPPFLFSPLLSFMRQMYIYKIIVLIRFCPDDYRRKPPLGFLLPSFDYFALCGGVCFFSGTSSWCREAGMLCQTRLFWDLSCKTLSYILKNTSNLYLFKDVLAVFRNYPEGHRRYFDYSKLPQTLSWKHQSLTFFFKKSALLTRARQDYFSLSSFTKQLNCSDWNSSTSKIKT